MRKRLMKLAVGTISFLALLAAGLWLVAPVFAKSRAIEKAKTLGLTMTVASVSRSNGGFTFEGVHVTSTDLPIEADLDSVTATLNGSAILHPKLQSLSIRGGHITVNGRVAEVHEKWTAWREKHHSSGSGGKISVDATALRVEWKSPCGSDDAVLTNVALSNTDGIEITADEVTASCLGWEGEAKTLHATSKSVALDQLSLARVEDVARVSVPRPSTHVLPSLGKIPEVTVKTLNVSNNPYSMHAENFAMNGEVQTGYLHSSVSFDSMGADLPKIHKIDLGKTEADASLEGLKFTLSVKSNGARGKVHGVTSNSVTLGRTAISAHGTIFADSTLAIPHVQVDSTSHIRIEETEVEVGGELGPGAFNADLELPKTNCQKLLDSVPDGMDGSIHGLQMSGEVAMQLHIARRIGDSEPAVKFHLSNKCKVTSPPDGFNRMVLRSNFTRVVPGPMGESIELAMGPKNPKWVPISQMSPFLVAAIQVTEDPNFYGHSGFDTSAIEESIKTDIALGSFVRGASTVTMQLAKNLWLSREKTLARKVQEAFLTIYLEQTLSKQELLETYYNVVEFGPMIYGIQDAADYYFKSKPQDLTLSQSLFIVSLLPNPKKNWFEADGKLQSDRQKHIRALMLAMKMRNLITQAQYEEGITEIPVMDQGVVEHERLN